MSDDIKLPEPSGYFYEWESAVLGVHRSCSNCTHNELSPHKSIPLFTADQLRAAVLADREERASAAEQASIGDAIRNGRRCIDRLDGYYDFECEGGPLRMNVEWDTLKRSFEHLCRHIERANGIVEKESGNG